MSRQGREYKVGTHSSVISLQLQGTFEPVQNVDRRPTILGTVVPLKQKHVSVCEERRKNHIVDCNVYVTAMSLSVILSKHYCDIVMVWVKTIHFNPFTAMMSLTNDQ